MPVENVLEVADLGGVRAVPGARPEVLGVRNLRGQILPVVDLARLLGIGRAAVQPANGSRARPGADQRARPGLVLVAEFGGKQVGFALDEVRWVGELGAPTQDAGSDLLAGAVLSGKELVGVIDVRQVFASLDGTAQ